jgi:hypothetical protein
MSNKLLKWKWLGYKHPDSIRNLISTSEIIIESAYKFSSRTDCIADGYKNGKKILIALKKKWYRVDMYMDIYDIIRDTRYTKYILTLWSA